MNFDPNTMSPCVLDLSEYQTVSSFHEIAASGVEGVILRCIRQNGEVDDKYDAYAARAKSVGLCVGAYVFLNGENGAQQADNLLAHCRSGVAPALDWETQNVPIEVAGACAQRIIDQTNVAPLVYGSSSFLASHSIPAESVLAKCPLWLAEYGPEAHVPKPWGDWSLWQYSDRKPTKGVGFTDADMFHRPKGSLADWWKAHTVALTPAFGH